MRSDSKFDKVRRSLHTLSSLADYLDKQELQERVNGALKELGSLRASIFEQDTPPKIKKVTTQVIPVIRKVAVPASYNPERYIPYRLLWAKVIIRAAYDYALWKESKELRLKKFAQDAEHWLFESSNLTFSFESICFAYDFPIERIRQKARALTKDDVKKLEFRERHGRIDMTREVFSGDDE